MKKNFFYLLIACLAFTFAACSDDDDDSKAKSVVPVTPPSNVEQIVDLELKQDPQQEAKKPLPFHHVSLLAENQVLVGPFDDEVIDNFPTAKTRSTTDGGYIAGGKYYLGYYMNDDEQNAILILSNKGQKSSAVALLLFTKKNEATGVYEGTDLVGVKLLDTESEQWVEMSCSANAKKIDKNEATATLCNTWKVAYSRLRHTGDVKAVHQFDKAVTGENPASLNDILAYALTKANIDQKFDENMVISQITFTPGRFIILFDNGKDYIGDWEWENRSKGELAYAWEDAEMGNAFESGMAVFDVRPYKQQDYYALTMGAEIEDSKASGDKKHYTVELTFFLQQKK